MNPLTEDEWNNLRNDFINKKLSANLNFRFEQMFINNEEVIPMIHFDGLSPEQKEEASNIWILSEIGEEGGGGRKHRRFKKYKRTHKRRSRKTRGRKSRRHR
jgi:hypothetical protein